jgi:hypothetical protein
MLQLIKVSRLYLLGNENSYSIVMEHMRRLGLKAVRIGPPGRINPNVWHMTLGERVKEHPMYDKFLGVHQSVNRKEKISETLHFDDEGK